MFPSVQPSRPRLPPSHSSPSPMNQQPTRSLNQSSLTSISQPQYQPPRNQMEAMPPAALPLLMQRQKILLDAATRHPVFFTDRLLKAPAGVGTGSGSWCSPVATGYVFNDGPRKGEGGLKL